MSESGERGSEAADLAALADPSARERLRTLLLKHRPRLVRMVEMRLDQRLQSGPEVLNALVDGALADAEVRIAEYVAQPKLPLFLWLRQLTAERLAEKHRDRLGREAAADISLCRQSAPPASSVALAAHLLGRISTPIFAEMQAQRLLRLEAALNGLEALDRDILSLRHFEDLSHQEAALALDLEGSEAARRYIRALKRLKEALSEGPGGGR